MRRSLMLAALAFTACGGAAVEVRIDETKGVPSLTGQTEVSINTNFTCGSSIPAGDKTVTTKVVSGGCEFTFDDTIEVLKASDYQTIGELKTTANLLQRVELSIKKVDVVDGTTGTKLDLSTRVTSLNLSVNGQTVIADKSAVTTLPALVKLDGAALTAIKSKVDARQPVSLAVKAVAVLPDSPKPPEKLKVDYVAQPAFIIGPGEVKLPSP